MITASPACTPMAYRDPDRLTCPRCPDVALGEVVAVGVTRRPCPACGGVWLDDAELGRMLEALGIEPDEPLGPLASAASELACVRCGEPTARELAYGGGARVEVDVCPDHGAWFDRDELAPVLQRLQEEVASRLPGEPRRPAADLLGMSIDLVRSLIAALRRPRPRPARSRGRPR